MSEVRIMSYQHDGLHRYFSCRISVAFRWHSLTLVFLSFACGAHDQDFTLGTHLLYNGKRAPVSVSLLIGTQQLDFPGNCQCRAQVPIFDTAQMGYLTIMGTWTLLPFSRAHYNINGVFWGISYHTFAF